MTLRNILIINVLCGLSIATATLFGMEGGAKNTFQERYAGLKSNWLMNKCDIVLKKEPDQQFVDQLRAGVLTKEAIQQWADTRTIHNSELCHFLAMLGYLKPKYKLKQLGSKWVHHDLLVRHAPALVRFIEVYGTDSNPLIPYLARVLDEFCDERAAGEIISDLDPVKFEQSDLLSNGGTIQQTNPNPHQRTIDESVAAYKINGHDFGIVCHRVCEENRQNEPFVQKIFANAITEQEIQQWAAKQKNDNELCRYFAMLGYLNPKYKLKKKLGTEDECYNYIINVIPGLINYIRVYGIDDYALQMLKKNSGDNDKNARKLDLVGYLQWMANDPLADFSKKPVQNIFLDNSLKRLRIKHEDFIGICSAEQDQNFVKHIMQRTDDEGIAKIREWADKQNSDNTLCHYLAMLGYLKPKYNCSGYELSGGGHVAIFQTQARAILNYMKVYGFDNRLFGYLNTILSCQGVSVANIQLIKEYLEEHKSEIKIIPQDTVVIQQNINEAAAQKVTEQPVKQTHPEPKNEQPETLLVVNEALRCCLNNIIANKPQGAYPQLPKINDLQDLINLLVKCYIPAANVNNKQAQDLIRTIYLNGIDPENAKTWFNTHKNDNDPKSQLAWLYAYWGLVDNSDGLKDALGAINDHFTIAPDWNFVWADGFDTKVVSAGNLFEKFFKSGECGNLEQKDKNLLLGRINGVLKQYNKRIDKVTNKEGTKFVVNQLKSAPSSTPIPIPGAKITQPTPLNKTTIEPKENPSVKQVTEPTKKVSIPPPAVDPLPKQSSGRIPGAKVTKPVPAKKVTQSPPKTVVPEPKNDPVVLQDGNNLPQGDGKSNANQNPPGKPKEQPVHEDVKKMLEQRKISLPELEAELFTMKFDKSDIDQIKKSGINLLVESAEQIKNSPAATPDAKIRVKNIRKLEQDLIQANQPPVAPLAPVAPVVPIAPIAQVSKPDMSLGIKALITSGVIGGAVLVSGAVYKVIGYIKATSIKNQCAALSGLIKKAQAQDANINTLYKKIMPGLTLVGQKMRTLFQQHINAHDNAALITELTQERARLRKLIRSSIFTRIAMGLKHDWHRPKATLGVGAKVVNS